MNLNLGSFFTAIYEEQKKDRLGKIYHNFMISFMRLS